MHNKNNLEKDEVRCHKEKKKSVVEYVSETTEGVHSIFIDFSFFACFITSMRINVAWMLHI
jgi:hypothetical protein